MQHNTVYCLVEILTKGILNKMYLYLNLVKCRHYILSIPYCSYTRMRTHCRYELNIDLFLPL
jgi:hypothetical protein